MGASMKLLTGKKNGKSTKASHSGGWFFGASWFILFWIYLLYEGSTGQFWPNEPSEKLESSDYLIASFPTDTYKHHVRTANGRPHLLHDVFWVQLQVPLFTSKLLETFGKFTHLSDGFGLSGTTLRTSVLVCLHMNHKNQVLGSHILKSANLTGITAIVPSDFNAHLQAVKDRFLKLTYGPRQIGFLYCVWSQHTRICQCYYACLLASNLTLNATYL